MELLKLRHVAKIRYELIVLNILQKIFLFHLIKYFDKKIEGSERF